MIRILVVLVAALGVTVSYTAPTEACGVKLTVKSPKVRKKVQRTSYPSHILVLGTPPSKRLTRWLQQAGHTVESTKNSSAAKRKDYAIVIADPEKVGEARSNFPRSRVVTRSGTLSSNVKKIERVLTRAPGKQDSSATMASRRPAKRSRPAGVTRPERVRRSRPEPKPEPRAEVDKPEEAMPEETTPEPAEDKEPVVAMNTNMTEREPEVEPKEVEEPVNTRPEPKRRAVRWTKEFFFGTNSSRLNRRARALLKKNARWLEDNPDVSVTIEGHTDAAGPAEYNKVLGERRAESVREYLIEKGVDSSRIEVISYGEERPAYDSNRKNRRVVLIKN